MRNDSTSWSALLFFTNLVFQRHMSPRVTRAQQMRSHVSEVAHESIEAALLVKVMGREQQETDRFEAETLRLRDAAVEVGRVRGIFDPLVEAIPTIGTLAVLGVGTAQVSAGATDPGRGRADRLSLLGAGLPGALVRPGGALRSIVGRLTIEEIIRDRAAFASAVAEEAESSLTGQGLVLDTFQLQDIQAEGSYLQDLGRPEAARVIKEASIAEAKARQAAEQEKLLAEEAIAVANRQLELKKAEVSAQIDAARAQAAAAGPLSQAAQDQKVLTEQEKVAERNAALKERQLDTEVRKPADAERYRVEQQAEANKNAAIAKAEADRQATIAGASAQAEQAKLVGEGERARRQALAEAEAIEGAKQGEAERMRRQAIADAVEREGAAEASAILARGQAEAEAMQKRSDAFSSYGEAAVLDLLVRVLPDIVGKAAEPLAGVDKMTVISADGPGSLTKSVASNVAQGLQLSSDLTGVDLPALLARLGGRQGSASGEGASGGKAKSAKGSADAAAAVSGDQAARQPISIDGADPGKPAAP